MEIIKIILTSVVSLFVLFILTKLMGNRQVSELTMFDYVIGISIGSIAAEMATDLDKPIHGVVAMSVYALFAVLISYITSKSIKMRRLFFGRSIELMENGRINKKALKKAHLDISEFLMQARTAGYFDLSQISFAFMEPNGKISFLPFSNNRPVTSNDLKIIPEQDLIFYNIITDGTILYDNLKKLGFNKEWLFNDLKSHNINYKDVLLATANQNGEVNYFQNII